MEITKSEAIENHRKMWNWIAEETLRQKCIVEKEEYFEAHGITDIPRYKCYCCEYDYSEAGFCCSNCPIEWGGIFNSCNDRDKFGDNGLYALWYKTTDYIKAAELAKQIAELPERKE